MAVVATRFPHMRILRAKLSRSFCFRFRSALALANSKCVCFSHLFYAEPRLYMTSVQAAQNITLAYYTVH